jgi:hypothetical protein
MDNACGTGWMDGTDVALVGCTVLGIFADAAVVVAPSDWLGGTAGCWVVAVCDPPAIADDAGEDDAGEDDAGELDPAAVPVAGALGPDGPVGGWFVPAAGPLDTPAEPVAEPAPAACVTGGIDGTVGWLTVTCGVLVCGGLVWVLAAGAVVPAVLLDAAACGAGAECAVLVSLPLPWPPFLLGRVCCGRASAVERVLSWLLTAVWALDTTFDALLLGVNCAAVEAASCE